MAGTLQTTRWSLILRAREPDARSAMDHLARTYWFPVYAYVRRKSGAADRALDLTQEFFTTFLEKRWVESADRARGRFRTFLLVVLDRFLADQRDRESAWKRGGRHGHVPFDPELAERLLADPSSTGADPVRAFTRDWALAVVRECLEALRADLGDRNRSVYYDVFVRCHGFDGRPPHESYGGLAREFGIAETDVTNYLHRARSAFRRILEARVLESVESPDELQAELAELMGALAP